MNYFKHENNGQVLTNQFYKMLGEDSVLLLQGPVPSWLGAKAQAKVLHMRIKVFE